MSRPDPDVPAPDEPGERTPAARPRITVCPDGPLLVRGDVAVVDEQGVAVPRNRDIVALCRCGRSTIKPWCDGSHKLRRGRPG